MKKVVIVGSGFAGMWAALSAARISEIHEMEDVEVVVIAPQAELRIRPRFYEDRVAQTTAPLTELYHETGVNFISGQVGKINTTENSIDYLDAAGIAQTITYDRLILASGSQLRNSMIEGAELAFNIDQMETAKVFEHHLETLTAEKPSTARNTVIVCGGGLTGIELATELPHRLSALFGHQTETKVIVVETNSKIAGQFSHELSQVISQASDELKIEWKLNTRVEKITPDGALLSNGEFVPSKTVVLTAGVQANPLTEQFNTPKDHFGRLMVDENLKVIGTENIFATGDVASAKCDTEGRLALMTCQHAIPMGKFAGNNAMSSLVNIASIPYQQPNYVTCIDLGAWGAVYTETWDQNVKSVRHVAKEIKKSITNQLIYPPAAIKADAFKQADPLSPFV